jgi:hypothetical protein
MYPEQCKQTFVIQCHRVTNSSTDNVKLCLKVIHKIYSEVETTHWQPMIRYQKIILQQAVHSDTEHTP